MFLSGFSAICIRSLVISSIVYYAPPLIDGGIKLCFCLTSVCRVHQAWVENREAEEDQNWWHTGSPRHMWLGHHFQGQKVKGQGHQAALLSTTLTRNSAATVSVGTYSAWESILLRCVCSAARDGGRSRRGVGAYCIATRTACYNVYLMYVFCLLSALLPIQVQGAHCLFHSVEWRFCPSTSKIRP